MQYGLNEIVCGVPLSVPTHGGAQVLPRHKALLNLLTSLLLGFLFCVHHTKEPIVPQLTDFVPDSSFFLAAEDLLVVLTSMASHLADLFPSL